MCVGPPPRLMKIADLSPCRASTSPALGQPQVVRPGSGRRRRATPTWRKSRRRTPSQYELVAMAFTSLDGRALSQAATQRAVRIAQWLTMNSLRVEQRPQQVAQCRRRVAGLVTMLDAPASSSAVGSDGG